MEALFSVPNFFPFLRCPPLFLCVYLYVSFSILLQNVVPTFSSLSLFLLLICPSLISGLVTWRDRGHMEFVAEKKPIFEYCEAIFKYAPLLQNFQIAEFFFLELNSHGNSSSVPMALLHKYISAIVIQHFFLCILNIAQITLIVAKSAYVPKLSNEDEFCTKQSFYIIYVLWKDVFK